MPNTDKKNFVDRHLQQAETSQVAQGESSAKKPHRRYAHIAATSAAICLDDYLSNGDGLNGYGEQIFTAYAAWRDATRDETTSRAIQLAENPPPDATELLGLEILNELDLVVKDLRGIFQDMRRKKKLTQKALLSNLRSALRIGKNQAPSDVLLRDQRRLHVDLFLNKYEEMGGELTYKSEKTIAEEVAQFLADNPGKFGIPNPKGWNTVLDDWNAFVAATPGEKERVLSITESAKLFSKIARATSAPKVERLKKVTPAKRPKQTKPLDTKDRHPWKGKT